jgi:starch-binding outer membrane protein, SusD/RagB family
MKKRFLFYVTFLSISLMVVYGCEKNFLDRKPKGQFAIETYFTTDKRALEGVVGVYDPIGWERTFDKMFWALGDGGSDDNRFGVGHDDGVPPLLGITIVTDYGNMKSASISPAFDVMYKGYYEGIYRANLVVKALNDQGTNINASLKKRLVAECKSLRALYYFMLVNYYGGVPLFTDPIDPLNAASAKLPRASATQVYDQVQKDLTDALPDLPTKSVVFAEDMKGRFTKGAAYALLAKCYLYQKKYTECITAANNVIATGEYALNADYFDNFRVTNPNSGESVLEIQHNQNSAVDNGGGWGADAFDGSTGALKMDRCFGGFGQNIPSQDLFNAFSTDDKRRKYVAGTVNDTIDGVTMCGASGADASMVKFILLGLNNPYRVVGRDDVSAINRVLIRYADVLMMKAEAVAAASSPTAIAPADAVNILTQIRSRAGLAVPTFAAFSAYTAEQLLRYIRAERRRELGMEGWRLFDLRRWGADSCKNALIRVGKISLTDPTKIWKDAYLLYPVPQSEIDLSGGVVVQNPGYN